jgi:putative DNA primase/helicase
MTDVLANEKLPWTFAVSDGAWSCENGPSKAVAFYAKMFRKAKTVGELIERIKQDAARLGYPEPVNVEAFVNGMREAQRVTAEAAADAAERYLNRDEPANNAKKFARKAYPLTIVYQDECLSYERGVYIAVDVRDVKASAQAFLDAGKIQKFDKRENSMVPDNFNPTSKDVNELLSAFKNHQHFPSSEQLPAWSDRHTVQRPPASECIAFPNCILHVTSGETFEPTRNFITRSRVDFDYDPNAPEPEVWNRTLKEYWPDDADADCIDTIQEWFGLSLTSITKFHKALFMQGPLRAGKGVIERTRGRVVGASNVVSVSLHQLGETFGMQSLIGKSNVTIPESKVDERNDNMSMIVVNFLKLTGGDPISVHRKNGSDWEGTLALRITLLGNELPRFPDNGSALANRLIVIPMHVSFLGRENPDLENQLTPELPGILNWGLVGLRRLMARGRFLEPGSGLAIKQDIMDMASPVGTFVEDKCILDPGARVEKSELFQAWVTDCNNNRRFAGDSALFGRDLLARYAGKVKSVDQRDGKDEGGKPRTNRRMYKGIRLKVPGDEPPEPEKQGSIPF